MARPKCPQPGGSDVNLNESQWLLVPPPSDVELPQKTRDQTRDHVVQLGSIVFINLLYVSCWNIPTQSDCLINLDGPYPFWRWCPAIQTQYSGSAPRIHAHPCCLLLDAFPSLLGPNQSPSQTGTKYQICWFTFYGTRIQHQPSTLPDIASLDRKSSSRNLFSRF